MPEVSRGPLRHHNGRRVEVAIGKGGKNRRVDHPQSRQPTHATLGVNDREGIVDCAHAAAACGMVGRLDISAYPGVHRSVVIEVDGGLDLFAAKGGQGVLGFPELGAGSAANLLGPELIRGN